MGRKDTWSCPSVFSKKQEHSMARVSISARRCGEETPFFCPFLLRSSIGGKPEDDERKESCSFARSFPFDRELGFSYSQITPKNFIVLFFARTHLEDNCDISRGRLFSEYRILKGGNSDEKELWFAHYRLVCHGFDHGGSVVRCGGREDMDHPIPL
jgi:hypothetical protein